MRVPIHLFISNNIQLHIIYYILYIILYINVYGHRYTSYAYTHNYMSYIHIKQKINSFFVPFNDLQPSDSIFFCDFISCFRIRILFQKRSGFSISFKLPEVTGFKFKI